MLRSLIVYCQSCIGLILSVGAGFVACLIWVQPVGAGLVLDGNTLYRLGEKENLCAITFDDGPSQHTSQLLDLLRERGVPATFFVLGTQVERRPQLIERMRDEGHEVANHSSTHVSLRHLPPEKQLLELQHVQNLLLPLKVTSKYMRPPFGRYDATTVQLAQDLGMRVVLWSVDSHDWKHKATMSSMRSVAGGPTLRGVFLFHDTHKPTIAAMPDILDELAAKGCRFVTLSDFLAENDAPMNTPASPLLDPKTGLPVRSEPTAPGGFHPDANAHQRLNMFAPPAPKIAPRPGDSPVSAVPSQDTDKKTDAASTSKTPAQTAPENATPNEGLWPFSEISRTVRDFATVVEQVFVN